MTYGQNGMGRIVYTLVNYIMEKYFFMIYRSTVLKHIYFYFWIKPYVYIYMDSYSSCANNSKVIFLEETAGLIIMQTERKYYLVQ